MKELIWLYGQVIFKIALPVSVIFYIIWQEYAQSLFDEVWVDY